MGRPSVIDRILRHDDNGEPVTVSDSIVADLRRGAYFDQACNNAGIHKDTAYGWRKIAATVRLESRGKEPARSRLTPHERRCLAFSDAVEEAEAAYEMDALETLGVLARGGLQKVKTVVKRGPPPRDGEAGPVLESTTTTERLAPDATVIEWRLERRFPKRYGRRVELTGDDGGPILFSIEERAAALAETLAAYLAGKDDAARVGDGADASGSA